MPKNHIQKFKISKNCINCLPKIAQSWVNTFFQKNRLEFGIHFTRAQNFFTQPLVVRLYLIPGLIPRYFSSMFQYSPSTLQYILDIFWYFSCTFLELSQYSQMNFPGIFLKISKQFGVVSRKFPWKTHVHNVTLLNFLGLLIDVYGSYGVWGKYLELQVRLVL